MLRLMISIGVETASAAVILAPVLLVAEIFWLREMSWGRRLLLLLFSVSVAGIFSATGVPAWNDLMFYPEFQLVPFRDAANGLEYLKSEALNVVLFLPAGFLAGLLWKPLRGARAAALGLGLSLFVEFMQIFTFRLTDVDDLLTNGLGALLGGLLAAVVLRFLGEDTSQKPECVGRELGFGFGAAFLSQFFFAGPVSEALWNLIGG